MRLTTPPHTSPARPGPARSLARWSCAVDNASCPRAPTRSNVLLRMPLCRLMASAGIFLAVVWSRRTAVDRIGYVVDVFNVMLYASPLALAWKVGVIYELSFSDCCRRDRFHRHDGWSLFLFFFRAPESERKPLLFSVRFETNRDSWGCFAP